MKTKKRRLQVLLSLLCTACLALGVGFLVHGAGKVYAAEDAAVSSQCPEGSENISLGKTVTASSSYEMPNEGWSAAFLTDGKIGTPGAQPPNGWSTQPGETTDPLKVAWVTVALGGECSITRIVLFPRNDQTYGESFPVNFQLQVSATGAEGSWKDVKTFTSFQTPTEPLVVDVTEPTTANYVRLYVTGRTGADNFTGGAHTNDGKLVQLCEMAVFGTLLKEDPKPTRPIELDRPALELAVGSTDRLKLTGLDEDAPTLTWTSDNEAIASVASDGTVTAKSVGKTTVRVSGEGIEEKSAPVTVVEKKYDFDENITISVFWLPTKTYLEGGEGDARWEEQFKLLADADVDWLAHVTDNDHTGMLLETKEDNLKAAYYAAKYGMHLTVADTRFGRNLLNMSDEEITALIEEYRNVPGVGGYYIWDEPSPQEDLFYYAQVYAAMKKADPNAYAHLNFLPMWAYTGGNWQTAEEPYRTHVGSWLDDTLDMGVEQDFIMYDLYPYTGFGKDMMRDEFFSHLDVMRKIGLEYGVKTATYLQSNGSPSKRSPSPAEIRYQAMTSLAYGYKQLSYFTWFLPTHRGETFNDAIVSDEGVPNPKTYDAVSALNKEIHALGKTLIRLDSLGVYLNGTQWGGQEPLPDDFVFQAMDYEDYTASLMRDKITGRNYVMIVNNDFTKENTFRFFLNNISSLSRVSSTTGALESVTLDDGVLTVTLAAGDAVLYALPEGMDVTGAADVTAAKAILARVEAEYSECKGDTTELDAKVEELRGAITNPNCSQQYIDELTEKVRQLLEAAKGTQDAPQDGGKKGCGASLFGSAIGGAVTAGVLLTASLFLCLVRKKRKK